MKALITGASSGIGYEMALYLSSLGYDIIAVGRKKENLEKLKREVKTNITAIVLDLGTEKNCYKLYNYVKKENIDILVNNAGFGVYGNFYETDLNTELEMIDLNIKTVHILTKLFLVDFKRRNSGYILNVASLATFAPGPLMGAYYASKAYVFRLSEAIYEELRRKGSNVSISVLCPGPVATKFNDNANIKEGLKGLDCEYVARYAIDKMFKRKLIIIPGFVGKITYVVNRLIPDKLLAKIVYNIQLKKGK